MGTKKEQRKSGADKRVPGGMSGQNPVESPFALCSMQDVCHAFKTPVAHQKAENMKKRHSNADDAAGIQKEMTRRKNSAGPMRTKGDRGQSPGPLKLGKSRDYLLRSTSSAV